MYCHPCMQPPPATHACRPVPMYGFKNLTQRKTSETSASPPPLSFSLSHTHNPPSPIQPGCGTREPGSTARPSLGLEPSAAIGEFTVPDQLPYYVSSRPSNHSQTIAIARALASSPSASHTSGRSRPARSHMSPLQVLQVLSHTCPLQVGSAIRGHRSKAATTRSVKKQQLPPRVISPTRKAQHEH